MVYTIYNWLGFLVQKGVYRFFGPIFIFWRIKLIFGGRTCFDPRGGGNSHMKQTGMLVVSLRVVNFGFWSRLGGSGQSATEYFMPPRSCLGFHAETQNYAKRSRSQIFFNIFFLDKRIWWLCLYIIKTHCMSYLCVFKRSLLGVKICLSHVQIGLFRGHKKLEPRPNGLL